MTIKEEIGRNYSTRSLGDKPYNWMDNTDLDINMFAMKDGKWSAEVKCISNPNLSTPMRIFGDETSAQHWARMEADKITRKTLNERKIRKLIRDIIKSSNYNL